MECFICYNKATENHHVIPKSLGGKKTIPLCSECHAKVHGNESLRKDNHSYLTKKGLQRAKARGIKLGNPKNLTDKARKKAWKANSQKAANKKENIQAKEKIKHLLNLDPTISLRGIAKELNDNGYKTSRGSEFKATTVKRLKDNL